MSDSVGCCLSDKKEKVRKVSANASPAQPRGEGGSRKPQSIAEYFEFTPREEKDVKVMIANKMRPRGSATNVWLTIDIMKSEFVV